MDSNITPDKIVLPDYPIENKSQDRLKRSPLATKVSEMISSFVGEESFVISIEGKWGAGKTSFVNLILSELKGEEIAYFIFNPWNFSDETSLLKDFFIRFSNVIEEIEGKRISRRLREYAGKLADMDLGVSYLGVSLNPLKILRFFRRDSSLDAMRRELDSTLSRIKKKIVVVIDDIDRLDKKETKLILKLVKLTADFPKTIFVLTYDRARIEDRITKEDEGIEGNDYLKKIIQVSFSLPIPDQQELWNLLFKDLDSSLERVYGKAELSDKEERRWGELFRSGLNNLFETIRDIKRYISSLRLDWSIMGKDDVNKIDFLGIEAIRVFAPKFYDAIPVYKELFIKTGLTLGETYRGQEDIAMSKSKEYQELLLNLIPDKKVRKSIDGICKELFPQLNSRSLELSEEWERELRICSPERFNFYFQLGIPFGEFSESQINELVANLGKREIFKASILQFKKEGRLRKVFIKLLRRRKTLGLVKIKTALSIFWELEKEIDDAREAVFDIDDIDTQVLRFAYQTLKELPKGKREPLLAGLIRKCPNIYYPIHLVAVLRQDSEKPQHSEPAILNGEDLSKLEKILVGKIKTAVASGSLEKEKYLVRILFRWSMWESADAVSSYIHSLVSTRGGLLVFLESFVSKVLSTGGNYNTLDRDSMAKLISIDEIESLVNGINKRELSQLSGKEREAIDLFKNPRNAWFKPE